MSLNNYVSALQMFYYIYIYIYIYNIYIYYVVGFAMGFLQTIQQDACVPLVYIQKGEVQCKTCKGAGRFQSIIRKARFTFSKFCWPLFRFFHLILPRRKQAALLAALGHVLPLLLNSPGVGAALGCVLLHAT